MILLDQRPVLISADDLKAITSSAAGTDEMQPKAVDVGLDLVEPEECPVTADALEHNSGVRPEHDGEVTAHG